jgi:hypothetical protein
MGGVETHAQDFEEYGLCQTSSLRTISNFVLPQSMILESRKDMLDDLRTVAGVADFDHRRARAVVSKAASRPT